MIFLVSKQKEDHRGFTTKEKIFIKLLMNDGWVDGDIKQLLVDGFEYAILSKETDK